MDFSARVRERLRDEERSQAWLSRRIGVGRKALGNYIQGFRPWPERVRRDVAILLDIRDHQEQRAA